MFPDAFLAHAAAHADFSKPSKFLVMIFQPSGLVSGGLLGGLIGQTKATRALMKPLNTAGLAFQCEQATLPGYSINTVEQKVFGAPFSIAANPGDYMPLELTFISMGDLWERKFFEDWMEFIMPKGSARSGARSLAAEGMRFASEITGLVSLDAASRAAGSVLYRDEYISTVQVISLHDTGIPNARYTFEEAYPVAVAPSPLNWGDDGIQRVTVTFKYTNWSREENLIKQIYDKFGKNAGVFVDDFINGLPPTGRSGL
jgi:hypothetical protein